MYKYLDDSILKLKPETYLSLLVILAPFLNFLSGINLDLYTPSMPTLATYYGSTLAMVKNTVSATLLGFAVGCLIVGILLDTFGRKRIMLLGLLLYCIASIMAVFCRSIEQLILIRFLQGMFVASVNIGCRAIIVDSFTGHRYTIALLYSSLAYGLGPIVGPFIGGLLQYHIGWQANFVAYAVIGLVLLLIFAAYVKESIPMRQAFSITNLINNYKIVLSHHLFLAAIILVGCCQIELMLYSTVGSFIVQNILHRTAIAYGNTALLVGCCYLLGTLTNRLWIKKYHLHQLMQFGFGLLSLAIVIQLVLAWIATLNLFTLVFPVMLICYSLGFIFPNVLARSLKQFPKQAGVATSLLTCLGIGLSGVGMFVISHINIFGLKSLAAIFVVLFITQFGIFYQSELSRS